MKKTRELKNYSLRQRLVKYNFLVVIVPIIFTAVITFVFLMSLMFMMYNDETSTSVTNARDLVTVFYCQYHVRIIENQVNRNANSDELSATAKYAANRLEKLGFHICVTHEEKDLYISDGHDREHFTQVGKRATLDGAVFPQSILYVDENTTVFGDIIYLHDGSLVSVMIESESDAYQAYPNLLKILTTISPNEFLLVMFIMLILTVLIIVFVVRSTSQSLLGPINELTRASKRIREGKLDEPVSYTGIKEISQFYEDFDEMRAQLKSAKEKQKHADEMRNSTYGGLTHDAKTAITAIKGYTQGLIENVADTPEKQKRYIHAIYDSALALEKLTSAISDISELESDTVPFNMEKVDMYEYLSDWFDELRRRTAVSSPEIEFVFENNVSERQYCLLDRFQFGRVLTNIVGNSLKYRRTDINDCRICLKTSVDKTSSTYIISISDNGKGIKPEESEKLFERFYRSDAARTDVRSGSGVGLSVAQQVVLRHNGQISAYGEPNKGVTVTIKLPVADIGEAIR